MSERLPYEEHLNKNWQDLPLPDENLAWEDMKRRLEQEDDIRPVAWWRKSCALWGLLLLLLAITSWFIYSAYNKSSDSNQIVTQMPESMGNGDSSRAEIHSIKKDSGNVYKGQPDTVTSNVFQGEIATPNENNIEKSNSIDIDANVEANVNVPGSGKKTRTGKTENIQRPINNKNRKTSELQTDPVKQLSDTGNDKVPVLNPSKEPNNISIQPKQDSILNGGHRLKVVDTQATKKIDSVRIVESTPGEAPELNKKDSAKDRLFRLSAGLAIQQQLPLNGQKATPYSSSGRKGSLMDYIPSVYFRMTRPEKWFVQAEFKYGAPQLTRQFVFNQKAVFDSVSNTINTTSERLRKTYYHQLPLTFHVYIVKNWSLGTGIVWNRFSSAVSEQTVSYRVPGTQIDSVVSNEIIKSDADSVFSKNYFQAVFETQFQWKRFSLGGRYAFGLQPYIRFTLPGGQRQEEKNSSLQLFLRYRLWEK